MPEGSRSSETLTLTTGGITLLGVLLSISLTVGFGLKADLWVKVVAGLGTIVLLALVVKLGSKSGEGVLARAADWMIGAPRGDGTGDRRS